MLCGAPGCSRTISFLGVLAKRYGSLKDHNVTKKCQFRHIKEKPVLGCTISNEICVRGFIIQGIHVYMKTFWKKRWQYLHPLIEALEKWRWLILAGIGLSLLWVEVQEFLVLRVLDQAFHYFEVFQYAVLLVSTGLLIELFARSNRAHKQAVKILEYKHHLSLNLTSNDDWETLINKVTEIPGTIAAVEETYLLINDPLSGKFDNIGHWHVDGHSSKETNWDPAIPCTKCLERLSDESSAVHLCLDSGNDRSMPHVYSLVLRSQTFPITVLKFRLKNGIRLLRDDEQIFNSIGDDIIAVLQTSQDRKRLSEMQSAQVAMAERRIVSTFVHDQLGQNLGYIHMKLDQLSISDEIKKLTGVRIELEKLREVANESYEIVRDILKKMQPETIPHLSNLLHEHAKTVSRRAGFELVFKSLGKPVHLPVNTQQLVFFTFREVLNNVEKHANAKKVDVLVSWNERFLEVSVTDNGLGFEPGAIDTDEHFGLEIMKERIVSIKGRLSIISSTGAGTVVSISIPLEAVRMVPA